MKDSTSIHTDAESLDQRVVPTKLEQLLEQWRATGHEGLFLIPGEGYRMARVVAQDGDVVVLAPRGAARVVLHYTQVVFRRG